MLRRARPFPSGQYVHSACRGIGTYCMDECIRLLMKQKVCMAGLSHFTECHGSEARGVLSAAPVDSDFASSDQEELTLTHNLIWRTT